MSYHHFSLFSVFLSVGLPQHVYHPDSNSILTRDHIDEDYVILAHQDKS